jgi:hypothetical protein
MSESRALDAALKVLPVLGACITFIWGVWVWKDNADEERAAATADADRYAESRRLEASRPFLETQLKFYIEAAGVASKIAHSGDQTSIDRFWELYYGELSLVENNDVALAMKDFGDAMNAKKQTELTTLAHELTERMRESLAKSWGSDAWNVIAH